MELSEEEKNAIEVINEKIEDINNMPINTKNKSTIKFLVEVQKVANELVDIANEIIIRQQKEIEKYEQQIDLEFVEKNFIEKNKVVSKDKIIEKRKELESSYKNGKIKQQRYYDAVILLEELLEEN